MRYDSCLKQAINSFFDSGIYVCIDLLVDNVIFIFDLLGDGFERYLVIFDLIRWIVQVEVIDIYNEVFSIWCRDYAVLM